MKRQILISIHPEHVTNIITGKKSVELRTTNLHLEQGQRIWIYTTAPVSAVQVFATIGEVTRAAPSQIWRRFGNDTGIDKASFEIYAESKKQVTAIRLIDVTRLDEPCPLAYLRQKAVKFHPPQGAIYLTEHMALLVALQNWLLRLD